MPRQFTQITLFCQMCKEPFKVTLAKAAAKFCSRTCTDAKKRAGWQERFWSKVEKTESCWLWRGGLTNKGYGCFYLNGKQGLAPRISWELANGPIPDGLCALHDCPGGDNRACVNPSHLFLGTKADNIHDMDRKGRRGTWHRKLSLEIARTIRQQYATGNYTHIGLAKEYGVGWKTISRILSNRAWREPVIPIVKVAIS